MDDAVMTDDANNSLSPISVDLGAISTCNVESPPSDHDDSEARLAHIEEIFCHQQMPILEKADLGKEYVERADTISRQNVAKIRGRPEGGIARAVRLLPLPGKTDAARKKRLERLLQIASLTPQVRTAARKAGVAHFQSALLEIAEVKTEEDQLNRVAELVARNHERTLARKNRTAGEKRLRAVIEYGVDIKREVEEALATFSEDHAVKVELPSHSKTISTQ